MKTLCRPRSRRTMTVVALTLVFGSPFYSAAIAVDSALAARIKALDTALFDAFNACNLEKMGALFSQDLEFYHDTGGLDDYAQTMAATKRNCDRDLGLRRELVPGSMAVYPVPGYGAIQKGSHTFCHFENGKNDCGTFEFIHVWRERNGDWQLARVISFGH